MAKLSSKTKGVFYIILAAFGFSLMSMLVKLAGDLPSFQKAFFRNFIALIFIFIMMLRDKTGFVPAKKNIPDLFGRCFFGTLGMLCNFYAIGKLNLSDANMLNKLSPFFAIIFSIILLKERPSIVQIAGYKHMTALQLIYLVLAGAFACVGQIGITRAYICAPAKEISVYDYTQVLFAAALGFFVFGDVPDVLSVIGYVLICGAGVGMFVYNKRR